MVRGQESTDVPLAGVNYIRDISWASAIESFLVLHLKDIIISILLSVIKVTAQWLWWHSKRSAGEQRTEGHGLSPTVSATLIRGRSGQPKKTKISHLGSFEDLLYSSRNFGPDTVSRYKRAFLEFAAVETHAAEFRRDLLRFFFNDTQQH